VVTPGDKVLWHGNPWSGAYCEGRICGRGAADAKGCVWAAALAIMALRATGADLRGNVVLESVVDEEDTGNGTQMDPAHPELQLIVSGMRRSP
jgi:acetylornithine deacetylase